MTKRKTETQKLIEFAFAAETPDEIRSAEETLRTIREQRFPAQQGRQRKARRTRLEQVKQKVEGKFKPDPTMMQKIEEQKKTAAGGTASGGGGGD